MTHPWTCVVGLHTDPETCGVARFNAQLAARLGVPLVALRDYDGVGHPLISLKWAELAQYPDRSILFERLRPIRGPIIWHDHPPNTSMGSRGIYRAWLNGVPALVSPSRLGARALFTFGMAHKLEVACFARLRARFTDMELWVSTAAHEGAGVSQVPALMAAWGSDARNLGTLSDDALGLVWPRAIALVAFFPHGLRANNTTVHAALDAGVPVITNHGSDTPADLRAITHDVDHLPDAITWLGPSPYTWDRLLEDLCAR